MKYVKTKDSIIERSRVKFLPNGKAELSNEHGSWQVDDLQIIDEADSVEELFDAYVGVDEEGKRHFMSKSVYRAFERKLTNKTYGAIWVNGTAKEPILVSVAEKAEGGWKLI